MLAVNQSVTKTVLELQRADSKSHVHVIANTVHSKHMIVPEATFIMVFRMVITMPSILKALPYHFIQCQ